MKRALSCLILDLDGTVADNSDMIIDIYRQILQKHLRRAYSRQEILSLFGPPEGAILKQLLPPESFHDALEDFYRIYEERHPDRAFLDRQKLEEIRSWGIRLAIFSGKGRRSAEITLGKLHLQGIFDVLVTGEDVSCSKPDPEGVRIALMRLEASPKKALLVGDSPLDIQAGRAAGVETAAALWGTKQRQELLTSAPDYVFLSIPDFIDHVRSRAR